VVPVAALLAGAVGALVAWVAGWAAAVSAMVKRIERSEEQRVSSRLHVTVGDWFQ